MALMEYQVPFVRGYQEELEQARLDEPSHLKGLGLAGLLGQPRDSLFPPLRRMSLLERLLLSVFEILSKVRRSLARLLALAHRRG
jgi:hypothetical protein